MYSALALVLTLLSPSPAPTSSPQHLAQISVSAPRARLTLQVANTEAEREQGLMNYSVLPVHSGMVFVFATDSTVSFWMKDTLIPLDMVFVGPDGRVRNVMARVAPADPSLPDERIPLETANAKYVIELPSGEAAQDGIVPGVTLSELLTLNAGTS